MKFQIDTARPIDIISMGRVAVDLYADQIGVGLRNVTSFSKYLGGCAGNIAVGCARQGLKAAMFSCVGTDEMGQYIKQVLLEEKVDTQLLQETNQHLTGLVLLGISPPDHFPLIFYRENCADMQLKPKHVNAAYIAKSKSLLITGTGLSTESMFITTQYTVDVARMQNTKVIIDLDYRPVLWKLTDVGNGEDRYKVSSMVSEQYAKILPKCDLIVGTEEEICIAGNSESISNALYNIRQLTTAPIVMKKGAQGCTVYLTDLSHQITATPFPVKILNVLGAGDGFVSGFLRGLLRNESWEMCAKFGNASGAILVTKHGCAPAMPTHAEMQDFIKTYEDGGNVRVSNS